MGYLDFLPSYDSLKGYCTDGVNYLSKKSDQYYPIVREAAVKCGKPAVTYIHAKTLEYPVSALIVANLGIIVLAKKIASISSYILSKLTCGMIPRLLTNKVACLGLIAGANYGIYRYVSLDLSLRTSIVVPVATVAGLILLNSFRNH